MLACCLLSARSLPFGRRLGCSVAQHKEARVMLRCTIKDDDCCDGDGISTCQYCSGEGFVFFFITCPDCDGTGLGPCDGVGCHDGAAPCAD